MERAWKARSSNIKFSDIMSDAITPTLNTIATNSRQWERLVISSCLQLMKRKPNKQAMQPLRMVNRLEALYSRYKPDSFLSEINRVAAVGGSIKVDEETASLLDYAVTCYEQSDGLFDITSGILRRAWKFDQGKLPEPSLINELIG